MPWLAVLRAVLDGEEQRKGREWWWKEETRLGFFDFLQPVLSLLVASPTLGLAQYSLVIKTFFGYGPFISSFNKVEPGFPYVKNIETVMKKELKLWLEWGTTA